MRRLRALWALLALALPVRATAQLSPGPLARAHAALEGATNCVKCHGLRHEPMAQLCLDCHREVKWSMDAGRGLHAREARDPRTSCATCHPDHAGTDFALIAWKEGSVARFDHQRAGWALGGKHATLACEKCHRPELRTSPAAALVPGRRAPGWIGLDTDCASCHRTDDPHGGALGLRCESCHTVDGWSPATRFEHSRSRYPLTGKHLNVPCDKCHLASRLPLRTDSSGKRLPLFRPVPFAECSSCHADPHGGRLSPKCSSCHTTQGFAAIDRGGFNHAATRYPLLGSHRTVACEGCHGLKMATPKPQFATCAGCHADPHAGAATLDGKAVDCAACHQVAGFVKSTFTVDQHQGTGFALAGKHLQVSCTACHTPAPLAQGAKPGSNVRFRAPPGGCAGCHADAHGGQLARLPGGNACARCHTDAGWQAVGFPAADHATLGWVLDGRHAQVACRACHGLTRPGLPPPANLPHGTASVLFAIRDTACAACHFDPHLGRFATRGTLPIPGGCSACHTTAAFRPSSMDVIRHALVGFPLEGAHRAAPCVACHTAMGPRPATGTLLRSTPAPAPLLLVAEKGTTCSACHASPHADQFRGRKGGDACESCHGPDSFRPATRFNHDRDATFALTGAHEHVACAACHKPSTAPDGAATVRYRPLSTKCESCHAKRPAAGGGR